MAQSGSSGSRPFAAVEDASRGIVGDEEEPFPLLLALLLLARAMFAEIDLQMVIASPWISGNWQLNASLLYSIV